MLFMTDNTSSATESRATRPDKSVKLNSSAYPWIALAIGFIGIVICWGIWRSFGVFFKPILEEFGWTRAETTGPTIVFFLMNGVMGICVGRLIDKYGPKLIIPAFGILMGAGYILTSQITTLWHFYISYGLIVGTGSVVSYIPFISVVSQWFKERRGAIMGILVSGIGVGMMIGPPVSQFLISSLGWRLSFVILGSFLCLSLIAAGRLLKLPPDHKAPQDNIKQTNIPSFIFQKPEKFELRLKTVLKTRALWILFFTHLALSAGIEMTTVHIVAYATDLNIMAVIGATLVTAIGAASTLGKLTIGALSDKIGRKVTMAGTLALLGLSLACLPLARDIPSLFIFAVIFGIAYGGYGPVLPAIIGDIYGVRNMGMLMGFVSVGAGTGAAIGPVLAGYIFDVQKSYSLAFWLAAALVLLAALAASRLKLDLKA
jgi:MFS family permease